MTEQVAEPAAEQQEPAEGEHVGVHHPGERGLREAQIRPDRREGDVHDRRVEDDHQVPAAEHEERNPAHAVRQVRHTSRFAPAGTSHNRVVRTPRGSGLTTFGRDRGTGSTDVRLPSTRRSDSAPPCQSTVASVPGSVAIVASWPCALPALAVERSPSTPRRSGPRRGAPHTSRADPDRGTWSSARSSSRRHPAARPRPGPARELPQRPSSSTTGSSARPRSVSA